MVLAQQGTSKLTSQPRVVYLGGPIDLVPTDNTRIDDFHRAIEWEKAGLKPYCPRCECMGLTDAQAIEQNMFMLGQAWLGIFDLRTHSIGTPIEMFLRCWIHQKPALLIGDERSMFIRETVNRFGAKLAPNRRIALDTVLEMSLNG